MIDNIIVDGAERILATHPDNLSRIEIITRPYYKGNMIYGGIISFYSKNGDFGGIELSQTDMFVKYKFFSEDINSGIIDTQNDNMPDTRNTLLWLNDLNLSANNTTSIDFQTPDTKGLYEVLLRGIDSKGEIVLIRNRFTVK
ncbi:MAG: hypothetical protein CVT98_10280 [Bacteroidetes bacterium HGW-Bacteroidetes-15]|nr:MAG: hypothetical protein CVT98_10280 [Bacteroidetes bacterium HGW-Bacteroidetes-15]